MIIQEKGDTDGEETLVALYGLSNAGKSYFFREFNKELEKRKNNKYFAGLVQTSDEPKSDLKQFYEMKQNHSELEFPLIFFHEISLGRVDNFTLENFGKFTDRNLYIYNPEIVDIDFEMIRNDLDKTRNNLGRVFNKPIPKTEIIFISNPESKIKKI